MFDLHNDNLLPAKVCQMCLIAAFKIMYVKLQFTKSIFRCPPFSLMNACPWRLIETTMLDGAEAISAKVASLFSKLCKRRSISCQTWSIGEKSGLTVSDYRTLTLFCARTSITTGTTCGRTLSCYVMTCLWVQMNGITCYCSISRCSNFHW